MRYVRDWFIIGWILLVVSVLSSGCMVDLASLVQQLKDDPATVCANITHPYGSIQFARTNIANGDVACQGGTLTVKSQANQVGVPITVVPQVTIGAPVATPPR